MLRPTRTASLRIVADDGDDLHFCSTCTFSRACLDEGLDKASLRDLHVLVAHSGPHPPGTHIFREGDPFRAIAAVRSGTVKTYRTGLDGRQQVLGFHVAGELVGLSAIDSDRYPCNAVALDAVHLCRFSFEQMAMLATRLPGLQKQLFRLISRDIGHAEALAGDHSAEERLAAFLVSLIDRLAVPLGALPRVALAMRRSDIANYLRLAPETVSRLLRQFQERGQVRVRKRELEVIDLEGLRRLAAPVIRN